jgi:hypothetical protein
MGKRGSSAVGAATGAADKKAKTANIDASVVGNWVPTKMGSKEMSAAEKIALLKNDPAESLTAGPKIIPWPPPGFWVIFLAFLLWGLSLPPHPFLRGLLFAYGVRLHDLNPNTILHIACFITLYECFLGIEPHWALWRRIFMIRQPLQFQTGRFGCQVRPDVPYFNLPTPENNSGWQTKWFYAKEKSSDGEELGLEEFRATTVLRPRVSWRHELSEEELKTTEPLMERIQKLRGTPRKELSGVQLIRMFIKCRIQPLTARAHCMWDYTDRRDSTRISPDELHKAEIDDSVCAVTNVKKKDVVPRVFGAVAFSKADMGTKEEVKPNFRTPPR